MYQIIANKTELDIYEDLGVALTMEIEDILSLNKRTTSWSKTIIIPGTPKNNKFFEKIFEVKIDLVAFNPVKKITTTMRAEDNQIFDGYMQLLDLVVEDGEVEYEVALTGVLSNFMTLLEGLYLRDIDLSRYNHVRDRDTIIKSMNYGIYQWGNFWQMAGPGEGYVYPYIVYGGTTDIAHHAFIYDLYPAVYLKTVVLAMFENIGYKLKSEFINSPYFAKLILPYVGDKIQIAAEEFDQRLVAVGIDNSVDYADATPSMDYGSNWYYNGYYLNGFNRESGTVTQNGADLTFRDDLGQFSGYAFVANKTGYYDIELNAHVFARYVHEDADNIQYQVGSGQFEWRYYMELVKNNGTIIELDSTKDPNDPNDIYGTRNFAPSDGSNHASPWIDTDTPLNMRLAASNVLIEAGEQVRVRYGFRYPQSVNWSGTDSKVHAQLLFKKINGSDFSRFLVTPSSNESMGNDLINMNQILPDNYKQTDLLADMVKMFNLVIVQDPIESNTLIMEPRDDYYANTQEVLNWEEEKKLDYDSGYKITPMSELDATKYEFSYSDDEDYYNKQYKEERKKTYGMTLIDVNNDFSDKTNSTKLSLAPTPNSVQFIDTKVAPFFVKRDGENLKQMKVKPRILFYGGTVAANYFIIQDFPFSTSLTTINYYPYCGMWDHPDNPDYSLEYSLSEKFYWNVSNAPNYTLFNMFHKATVNNIIDPNAKLLEGKFKLTPKDIAEFDFRNVVFLLGRYWRVNTIKDYDPSDQSKLTNVVLYTISDVDAFSRKFVNISTSNASCPTDVVLRRVGKKFRYVSKSGQTVTEDCCKSLNGDFVNGVCYIASRASSGPVIGIAGPISDPTGPVVVQDGNILLSNGIKTHGVGNYVPAGLPGTILSVGNNNGISKNLKNVMIIGDNVKNAKANTLNVDGAVYDKSGIGTPAIDLIQAPKDSVRNLFPDNPLINKVKSGTDSVRDADFTSTIGKIESGRDSV